MNLPQPLFWRLRRMIRRRAAMNFCTFLGQKWTPARENPALAEIEGWSGRRPRRGPLQVIGMILLALVTLAFVLAFAGCAASPGTVPKHVPIPPPPLAKRVDISPAQRSTTEASRSNAQASGSVGRIAAELSGLKLDFKGAVSEADRLRKQKAASERELELLWKSLTEISTRHDGLAKEAESAKGALAYQTVTLRNVEDHLAMVQRDAEAKEVEASVLRASLSTAEKLRETTHGALEKSNEVATESLIDASKAQGERNLWRWIAGGIGLLLGAYILIPIILRSIKP